MNALLRRTSVPATASDAIMVQVESVELKGRAATVKPPTQLLVEIDMPGDEGELKKIPVAPVKLGVARFPSSRVVYDVSNTKKGVAAALIDALETQEEEDSELLLNVIAVSPLGALKSTRAKEKGAAAKEKAGTTPEEALLGTASVRLERILATSRDLKSQALTVSDDSGAVVAEVRVSITALAALTSLERLAKEKAADASREKALSDNQVRAPAQSGRLGAGGAQPTESPCELAASLGASRFVCWADRLCAGLAA